MKRPRQDTGKVHGIQNKQEKIERRTKDMKKQDTNGKKIAENS